MNLVDETFALAIKMNYYNVDELKEINLC